MGVRISNVGGRFFEMRVSNVKEPSPGVRACRPSVELVETLAAARLAQAGCTIRRMRQRNLPRSGPRVKPAPVNMPTEPLNRKDAESFF